MNPVAYLSLVASPSLRHVQRCLLRECQWQCQSQSSFLGNVLEFVRIIHYAIGNAERRERGRAVSVCDFAGLCNDTLRYLWGACAGFCTSTMCVRIVCIFICNNMSTASELVERAPQKRMAKWGIGRVRDWQCNRCSALSFCASRKVH